jgi:5'-AMP-activated protein kinase catalytic alpha subunit
MSKENEKDNNKENEIKEKEKKEKKDKKEGNEEKEKDEDEKEYSKKIGDYILFEQIGQGTFSKVTRAFHIITEQIVAVKILDKQKIEDEIDIERIIREIEILRSISHPNISQMYETYSTVHNFYLMMEYVEGGDLFDFISDNCFLPENKACFFFRQLISVMEYLSELGISHRDIKPENILLDKNHENIKVIDFGLSNYCMEHELLHSSCGSPCYASPEMLSGNPYSGISTDLWSAGIVLYSMLVGALPFDDQELHKLYEQIKLGKFYIPSTLSLEAIDLLKRILQVAPNKRIKMKELKEHKWFNNEENPMYKGVNIFYEHLPGDTKVVQYVIKKYFSNDQDISLYSYIKMIHIHACNKYTATYYIVKKYILKVEDKHAIRKTKQNKIKILIIKMIKIMINQIKI